MSEKPATDILASYMSRKCLHSAPELRHDGLALLLNHVSVHGCHREVALSHLLCQPINLNTKILGRYEIMKGIIMTLF